MKNNQLFKTISILLTIISISLTIGCTILDDNNDDNTIPKRIGVQNVFTEHGVSETGNPIDTSGNFFYSIKLRVGSITIDGTNTNSNTNATTTIGEYKISINSNNGAITVGTNTPKGLYSLDVTATNTNYTTNKTIAVVGVNALYIADTVTTNSIVTVNLGDRNLTNIIGVGGNLYYNQRTRYFGALRMHYYTNKGGEVFPPTTKPTKDDEYNIYVAGYGKSISENTNVASRSTLIKIKYNNNTIEVVDIDFNDYHKTQVDLTSKLPTKWVGAVTIYNFHTEYFGFVFR